MSVCPSDEQRNSDPRPRVGFEDPLKTLGYRLVGSGPHGRDREAWSPVSGSAIEIGTKEVASSTTSLVPGCSSTTPLAPRLTRGSDDFLRHLLMASADNPRTGAEFERQVQAFFAKQGLLLQTSLTVEVGGAVKRPHKFDLGSETPPVLVECKCHVWTEGGHVPSAKLTV